MPILAPRPRSHQRVPYPAVEASDASPHYVGSTRRSMDGSPGIWTGGRMRESGLAQSPRRVPARVAESTRQHLDHLDERDSEILIPTFVHSTHRLPCEPSHPSPLSLAIPSLTLEDPPPRTQPKNQSPSSRLLGPRLKARSPVRPRALTNDLTCGGPDPVRTPMVGGRGRDRHRALRPVWKRDRAGRAVPGRIPGQIPPLLRLGQSDQPQRLSRL